MYIINELITGGELKDVMRGSISIERVQVMLISIGKGLLYCHSQNVIHRDLKPDNVLYGVKGDDTTLKIIDFGFAKTMTV